jgi:hypothetical protein
MSEFIKLTRFQLGQMMNTAAELGASRVVEKKDFLSKRAADLKYGRRTVDRWIKLEYIQPIMQNRRIKLDFNKLNELSKVDELYGKFIAEPEND